MTGPSEGDPSAGCSSYGSAVVPDGASPPTKSVHDGLLITEQQANLAGVEPVHPDEQHSHQEAVEDEDVDFPSHEETAVSLDKLDDTKTLLTRMMTFSTVCQNKLVTMRLPAVGQTISSCQCMYNCK